jgi:hypothetical protein
MNLSKEDKLSYVQYLRRELRKENAQPETIAKMVNLNNLSTDLNSISLN